MARRESSQWDPHMACRSLPLALCLYHRCSCTLDSLLRGGSIAHRFHHLVQRRSGAMGLLCWLGLSMLLPCSGIARCVLRLPLAWLRGCFVVVSVAGCGGQLHHGIVSEHPPHRMR
jgi:hypothetical protein